MTYEQALNYIHSLPRFGQKPGIDNMRVLCKNLGDPQNKLKFVHIAGTNGKGSTAAMVSNILQSAGYKTGLNISPFILSFCERFQINGNQISRARLAEITEKVKKAAAVTEKQTGCSVIEFEAVTAIAFLWFCEENCDIVVLEVGLGGRMDQTNIITNTEVAVITKIGLDHTAQLGNNIAEIAGEKCGIIKKDCTAVSYPAQRTDAEKVIKDAAEKAGVQLIVPETEDIKIYGCGIDETVMDYGGYEMRLKLVGAHQASNAAVAVQTALALCERGFDISDEAIIEGIENTRFPARIEVVSKNPLIILDGCHNTDSVNALVSALAAFKLPKMTAVIGILRDKKPNELLKLLAPCFDTVYTVTPDNPRAVPAAELAQAAREYFDKVEAFDDLQAAVKKAKSEVGGKKGLCICGSLYLAAQARQYL